MAILHVLGARPNFPKAAPVVRALDVYGVPQQIVHTGQHYDALMSDVFFADLGLPEPVANLGVGSGSHGAQTAALLTGLEDLVAELKPEMLLVYGDVNSTLAAALVCAKAGVRYAHVEAGLRSFDRAMPEEVNRIVVDALADLLFVTSPEAIAHLATEGVPADRIHLVGNPMIDSLLIARPSLRPEAVAAEVGVTGRYAVATLHRPANVDDPVAARAVVDVLRDLAALVPVVLPLHPRGRAQLNAAGLDEVADVLVVEPLGYHDFMSLVSGAALVLTDSGGVQEETTVLEVPCLTLRTTTERPITISHGSNRLVTHADVADAARKVLKDGAPSPAGELPPLWDGRAGDRIARIVAREVQGAAA